MTRSAHLLVFALWFGCQGRLLTVHVAQSAQTTVERGTVLEELVGDVGFDSFLDMDLIASQELANQGVAPGDVVDVRLTLFELEALDPAGADLSFLDVVELYVEAPDLDSTLVASASDFAEGQALVVFEVEDVDLTDYVVSQSMTLTTEVTGHRPDVDTLVEARFELDVGVTGQGACNLL